jgi:hypothetical protein
VHHRETTIEGRGSGHDIVMTKVSVDASRNRDQRIVQKRSGGPRQTNGRRIGRGRFVDGAVSLYDGAVFYADDTKRRRV